MTETVAIIQARMGSTRLPEKVLRDIGNQPMLWHVHERTSRATFIDTVVVATSTESQDDAVAQFCADHDIHCYRGSETDVLDRYYQAASEVDATNVVRITADCPLMAPAAIDRVVRQYESSEAAYVSNILDRTYPDGLDVEAFDMTTLERAWEESDTPEEREHVTLWMHDSESVDCENVANPVDVWAYDFAEPGTIPRWTVDYPEDMEFAREVYDRLTQSGHWVFGQLSVLELLEQNPELVAINRGL
jgi:spore coat polysaccharide biosynthesis protein SpsF (cytidylyltransferase family)